MEKIDSKDNFIELLERYRNLVFSICLKMTGDYFAAEDLAQETFISAYKNLDSFNGAEGKAWLCRIASNKCIDWHRASARNYDASLQKKLSFSVSRNKNKNHDDKENHIHVHVLPRCLDGKGSKSVSGR